MAVVVINVYKPGRIMEEIAPISFQLLKCAGLWRSLKWSAWSTLLYFGYTAICILLLLTNTLGIAIAIFQMSFADDAFPETMFVFLAFFNSICKSINILRFRERITAMLAVAQADRWQNVHNLQEIEILNKQRRTIRLVVIS